MSTSTAEPVRRASLWARLSHTARAMIAGFAVLIVGGGVSGALMLANLASTPQIPWFLPATCVWLWSLWCYLNGAWWPAATARSRRRALRAYSLSFDQWVWAIIAGALAVTAVMGVAFYTYQHATLPEAAYRAEFPVADYPWWTIAAIFMALALTAGVVEEAAFRGFMLSGIQQRHGWIIAISLVTLVFYVSHLSHAYASLAFLPFFILHGLVFGALVFATRSIVPGVILHTLSDIIVLPMQYGVISISGAVEFRRRRLDEPHCGRRRHRGVLATRRGLQD
ncbi:MAG: lysostaphin resistance A-like protein [Caulobacteraceae bacterium]